jgi:transcription termination factor Rho
MFDISALKEMKLSELQEIAKKAKTIKFTGVKKDTLISLILEHQKVSIEPVQTNEIEGEKPKRARIVAEKKAVIQKNAAPDLFESEEKKESTQAVTALEKKAKVIVKATTAPKVDESI